jgi:D-alanine-D-alanine ligase
VEVGIAYDLVSEVQLSPGEPEDLLDEYDPPETIDALEAALQANGLTTRRLGGGERLVRSVIERHPDLVFNIAEGKGTRSREAHVPAVLELLGIPYTHSDPLTLALSLDKAAAKTIVAASGVPTPAHQVVDRPDFEIELTPPLVAKPLHEGSSIGIHSDTSILRERSSVGPFVRGLLERYRQPVLLEELCPGAELTVGIVGTGADAEPIGAMEIAPRDGRVAEFLYSSDVKHDYERLVDYHVPPRCAPGVTERAIQIALDAYRALGCRDVGRIDLRIGADGEPKFLEANPLPGIDRRRSDIVILAGKTGLEYEQLIGRIVASARERHGI